MSESVEINRVGRTFSEDAYNKDAYGIYNNESWVRNTSEF